VRRRSALGSLLLFLGIGLLGLLLIHPAELPVSMPRSWYIDRTLWVAGGLICVGTGWYLLRDDESDKTSARHSGGLTAARRPVKDLSLGISGPRFTRLVLYTRAGCHLCENARAMLERYPAYLPAVIEVDIDQDPELVGRFSTCVPVVEFDGKVRFRGRVSELLLRRLIAATPPLDTTRPGDDL
jgi:hypothetical protein